MPIVKTDLPMTYRLCRDTIAELTETYPVCSSRILTTTAFGREVLALGIGSFLLLIWQQEERMRIVNCQLSTVNFSCSR